MVCPASRSENIYPVIGSPGPWILITMIAITVILAVLATLAHHGHLMQQKPLPYMYAATGTCALTILLCLTLPNPFSALSRQNKELESMCKHGQKELDKYVDPNNEILELEQARATQLAELEAINNQLRRRSTNKSIS